MAWERTPDSPGRLSSAARGSRPVTDSRGPLLVAALGFAGLPRPSYDRPLWALHSWLDSWSGIGHVTVGMARQGYDLQLTPLRRARLTSHPLHDRDRAPRSDL
jgi:hypothetical protein